MQPTNDTVTEPPTRGQKRRVAESVENTVEDLVQSSQVGESLNIIDFESIMRSSDNRLSEPILPVTSVAGNVVGSCSSNSSLPVISVGSSAESMSTSNLSITYSSPGFPSATMSSASMSSATTLGFMSSTMVPGL